MQFISSACGRFKEGRHKELRVLADKHLIAVDIKNKHTPRHLYTSTPTHTHAPHLHTHPTHTHTHTQYAEFSTAEESNKFYRPTYRGQSARDFSLNEREKSSCSCLEDSACRGTLELSVR